MVLKLGCRAVVRRSAIASTAMSTRMPAPTLLLLIARVHMWVWSDWSCVSRASACKCVRKRGVVSSVMCYSVHASIKGFGGFRFRLTEGRVGLLKFGRQFDKFSSISKTEKREGEREREGRASDCVGVHSSFVVSKQARKQRVACFSRIHLCFACR